MALTKSQNIGKDLTKGPIFRHLITFAIPIILASLIQQVYTLVDLMVIGKYVGNVGTVGVSVGSEMCDHFTALAMAFTASGQIYLAQLVGERDEEKAKKVIGTLFAICLWAALIFMAIGIGLNKTLLNILNCPDEAYGQAANYLIITSCGLPFIFGYNAVCSVLRAMGESKKPLIFIIVAAVTNIFADLLFVVLFHMEAAGTALATVLSQLGSFIAAFICLYKHRDKIGFEFRLSFLRIDKASLQVILRLAIPQLSRSVLIGVSLTWISSSVNDYGMVESATNSVGNKVLRLCEVFVQGINAACGAMLGQNLGARQHDRSTKICWYTLAMVEGLALLSCAVCLLFPRFIFDIFSDDVEVIEFGVTFLRIICVYFFFSALLGPFQAMVQSSGFVTMNFMVGVLDGVVCRIGFSYIFAYVFDLGVIGFFWGTALSRALPSIMCFLYFLSGKWKTRKLLSQT